MTRKERHGSTAKVRAARESRIEALGGEARLRAAIDDLANQLCLSVDGDFDFSVRAAVEDETVEKLSMLVNFVLDTARRGMSALREHNLALAQLDQAKTVFFSNASHELRTPLTLILGPIENALEQPDGALAGAELAMAHRNALRLQKLVNALLDFSRIEAGRLQGSFVPTDLTSLTFDLAAIFRSAAENAGLEYRVECAPLPEPVYVDRDMWEGIVLNLISNAYKATFSGSIVISLRCVAERVELCVRDTGTGIAADDLPRLFERFHRVPAAQARSHEGFGIGLALTQELARLHGGSITVQSELGKGSSFTVAIPRGYAHLPAERVRGTAPDAPQPSAKLREAGSGLAAGESQIAPSDEHSAGRAARILVADDNADMRAYLTRLLAPHWVVQAVADGSAALQAARRQPPDLVLADVMMPGVDGPALLRELRAQPTTRHIPILLLSARAGPEAVAEGLEIGADDYLIKPFAARELIARVRTHLELSRLRSDNAIIQRVGALLNERLDLETIVQTLTDEAVKLSGAQFGAFFYNCIDQNGESYMLYTLAGAPRSAFENFPLPRNTEVFAPTYSGQGTVRIDDVHKDPRYGKSGPYHGMPPGHLPVCSYLAVPVVSRGGVVLGGLFFGHAEPCVFTERSARLIEAVAIQAAVAIDNAQLYERAQAARADAEAASRAKDEFLAMLGHELRNPLAPIVTALDVMGLRGESAVEPERAVIRRQVMHMVRLVEDLLDVSRITRGKVELAYEDVELSQVIARATEIASPLLEQRHHCLELQVPAHGMMVCVDPVRLAQVVANLLQNAAKFTLAEGKITLSGEFEGGEVVIRVKDNGIGIPPESLKGIFELFEQGPQNLDRSFGGLGLGLAIARSLVVQHRGTIKAFSEGPGRGSEFEIRLPRAGTQAAPATLTAAPERLESEPDTPLRVLVVDDNVDAAHMLSAALTMLRHETRIATHGSEALQLAASFAPDVVLLDLGLPGIDGFEVARRLRAQPGGDRLWLAAITGYGQPADRDLTREAGFDQHLVKPVEISALTLLLQDAKIKRASFGSG